MRIHYLQHVFFEGPGVIADYAASGAHSLTATRLFEGEKLPDVHEVDLLVVMGGPMNIYEEDKYPWLIEEKRFILEVIHAGKPVLGICLGAQLIADLLGAPVFPGDFREIGWFPIFLTDEARQTDIAAVFSGEFPVFHWHGDTFAIPEGAVHLALSPACKNQAFIYGNRILALQFHLESTPESIKALVENCGDEIVEGRYVQSAAEMLSPPMGYFRRINHAMYGILDQLLGHT